MAVADQPPLGEQREVVKVEMAPGRATIIGAHLGEPERARLVALLEEYTDIFAFTPEEMPGIDRSLIEHRLSVNKAVKPVKQK